MLGLYIHIPFCQQKCFYCDFVSYANMESSWSSYAKALRQEISHQTEFFAAAVDTVYIGGGTPTIWPTLLLTELLTAVSMNFSVRPDAEITVEANPGTIDEAKLMALREAGVNRLSFGVQAFQDHLLKKIGRIHTAKEAEQAVELAKKCSFENISIDLMYGLPSQTLMDVEQSIQAAIALDPQHISVYGLKVEEGTPFDRCRQQGTLCLPDDEDEAAMYAQVISGLPQYGYERYEISNFAKHGFASRHNSRYWQYQPYIGFGAGAHSFNEGKRYANTEDVAEYIRCIEGRVSAQIFSEPLTRQEMMAEYCFLALRTSEGISRKDFESHFQCSLMSVYGSIIAKLIGKGLIKQTENQVALTPLGMQYGNQVFCEFILD